MLWGETEPPYIWISIRHIFNLRNIWSWSSLLGIIPTNLLICIYAIDLPCVIVKCASSQLSAASSGIVFHPFYIGMIVLYFRSHDGNIGAIFFLDSLFKYSIVEPIRQFIANVLTERFIKRIVNLKSSESRSRWRLTMRCNLVCSFQRSSGSVWHPTHYYPPCRQMSHVVFWKNMATHEST